MKRFSQPIEIEKIVNGGLGLGRLENGRIVLVAGTLPGERVSVNVTDSKKDHLLAEVVEIERSSRSRIDPPCPWYAQCGGCDLQHCDYAQQLAIKAEIVRDLVQREFRKTDTSPEPLIGETLEAPAPYGYRQRIRLQADSKGRLGFLGYRSHTVVPVDRCLVAAKELNDVLAGLRQSSICKRVLSNCREVELLLDPGSSGVIGLFHLTRKPRPSDRTAAQELVIDFPSLEQVFFAGDDFPMAGPFPSPQGTVDKVLRLTLPPFSGEDTPTTLSWEVGGFCQVNLQQNHSLIRMVLEACAPLPGMSILDLFCGMGNFSIPLAKRGASLVGIEGQGSAIRSAKNNSRDAGLVNTTFLKEPVHQACRRLVLENRSFDCVVLDPPRQGAPGLAADLSRLAARKLVYVSCDPATLARDLAALCIHGFAILQIRPVDMFPQTHHIETVAVLEKN